MALTFTYATLKSALQNFTEDTGSEFESNLDLIIPMGETRLVKDLDLEIFDVLDTDVFSGGSPIVVKPANMVALRSFHYIDGSSNYTPLEPKTWEFAKDYWPNAANTTASPKYYVEYSSTQWYIAGTPASNLSYAIRYIARPTGLTATNTTTWLSTNAADVLLYACLISAEQFLKADERVGLWKQEYMSQLATARTELRRTDRNDYMPIDAAPDAA